MSEYETFPLKSFNIDSANANSHPREVKIAKKKNLPTTVAWTPSLCSMSAAWRSQMRVQRSTDYEAQGPHYTEVPPLSLCLNQKLKKLFWVHYSQFLVMALSVTESMNLIPYGWQGFVDWRQLWGTEHSAVLCVDVSCLDREEIKPPQGWVLHTGWKALERFHYYCSSKALHSAASQSVMHSSHRKWRVRVFHIG